MNTQDRFDAELRAWLRTKAGDRMRPVDLVARGMGAVRATSQARGWRSLFAAPLSLQLTVVGAAAVVVISAVVVFSLGPRPVPPPGTSSVPSSSAAPTATATSLPVAFTTNAPTDPGATWTGLTWRKVSNDVLSQVTGAFDGAAATSPSARRTRTRRPSSHRTASSGTRSTERLRRSRCRGCRSEVECLVALTARGTIAPASAIA